ncbi:RICIN domain-containing protein [Streptomyces sp. NPDC052109]|uniref:ricin-type beta-trefoil lectin domain protein n=1 Tax=Streptomyces sp. NPDC052109 TaxID=3155527 RepID=UPI003426E309
MPASRPPGRFTSAVTAVAALAVVAGLAVQPGSSPLNAEPASDSYPWYQDTAAEQLRQDQCLMTDVLRLGGPSMAATAQDGLNQSADKLHVLANRERWEQTPLSTAYQKDRDAAGKDLDALSTLQDGWKKSLDGLTTPAGFTDTGFHWPPGTGNDGQRSFYEQTGLTPWIADRFWRNDVDFYNDDTPKADDETLKAVDAVGGPLYGKDPDPAGTTQQEWNRALAEHSAFQWMHGSPAANAGADDARVFLSSGGFPRTAPQPGTPEFRIAVEDVKSRFAACGWRDPLDPDDVLGDVTSTAAGEWQQEVSSQAAQRNQILDADKTAVEALAKGAKALGEMLGHSWVADRLTRWQDYWQPGGLGWVGDSPAVIEVHAAKGKCLDVQGGKKDNGTPVQVYTCNGSAAQKWVLYGSEDSLHLRNVNSLKCLDVQSGNNANGTKIQISSCTGSPAQTWDSGLRGATSLKNAGTGKCLDLHTLDNGNDAQLYTCNGTAAQQFDIAPSGHSGTDAPSYPDKAQFDKAKAGITAAQAGAKKQLAALKAQLATAQTAATTSDTALQAAYGIADANGAPRGRGLLVGQQKAQVTRGAAAALAALEKAGETAEAATRASADDSETIAQRALAQAAQAKAEFRKEAAKAAEEQAKAAADAAKVHRDNAKADKETAEARLGDALKAEGDAKAAAADAHAKRLAAEAEEKTAKAEKETAAAEQAEAAQDRKNAEDQAGRAKDAKDKADAAEKTAEDKRDAAVKAKDDAKAKRDDAWDAEQKADAARAKADAKDAYADKVDSGDAADAARSAADAADKDADDAETAAKNARAAADAATQAAADADAAATRAEAAAKRARSDADAAQADKAKADAAVKTATSAAADAIKASQDAATEARTAVKLADEAEQHAKDAKAQADAANTEAGNALAASAKAAGYAHVTAQAAVDAGKAAEQVANPANDAIQLGSAYVDTDSAAGLVVLTGQASKTIADQQQAVADAHAKNAAAEADAAKNLADQAKGDAKEAYQHAANAARYAADARTYSKEALGYAADAAKAAAAAQESLARTIEYDKQAADDAAAADKAADNADGYAKDARSSADAAELDADAARSAAAQAEQDAKDARAAADRADTAATEAEQAAKDADKYAKDAQDAADQAERNKANQQVQTGAGTGVGGVFSVIDDIKQDGDPEQLPNECHNFNCNTMVYIAHFDAVVSYYLCLDPDVPATESGCPVEDTIFLKTVTVKGLSKKVKVSALDVTIDLWKGIFNSIKGDFTGCYHKITGDGDGTLGDCAWAATWLPLGGPLGKVADAIRSVDAALRSGEGVADALKALKTLDVDAETLAEIERQVDVFEEARTACNLNSFPGTTEVVLADGSRKALRDVRTGDLLLATDPATGRAQGEPVTRTFHHTTVDLVDLALADGGRLTSTPGHRFYVVGRGWTLASDLRRGDALRGPDGTVRTVAVLLDRHQATPRTVYDLTVSDLHTFYAVAGTSPVLVHNCDNLALDEAQFKDAHTLEEHVRPDEDEAKALSRRKTEEQGKPTPNSVWVDEATAQKVLDFALSKNASRISKWMRTQGGPVELPLRGSFGPEGSSLGKVFWADRATEDAGNQFFLKLVKSKGRGVAKHPRGYYVQTFFPV